MPMMFVSLSTIFIMAAAPLTEMTVANTEQDQGPLKPDELALFGKEAIAYLQRSPLVKYQRLRVLSIKRLPEEIETNQRALVSILVFNYSQGNATRVIIDPSGGAVLRAERLRGRPQASEEERQEASQIIKADSVCARMLRKGILEGGFIVDAPRKESMRDRFVQFQILTSNREGLQRVVVVNLTTGRIAESRPR